MKYESAFKNNLSSMQVFTAKDAGRFLRRLGASDNYVRLFLHNMVAKKEIFRINRGYYSFSNNEVLSGFAFRPFYYGLEYALTIRNLWTQQASPVIVTTIKTNAGIRKVLNREVIVRRISAGAFFGFEYIKYSGAFVPVSTLEKTLLDFIYYRTRPDRETLAALIKAADKKLLMGYAQKLGEGMVKKARTIVVEERRFEGVF